VEPESEWGVLDDGTQSRAVPTEPGAYQEYYAAVARALRGAGPVPVDARDAVAVLEVIESARRQAASTRS
jgi:predicted dehydrogenase